MTNNLAATFKHLYNEQHTFCKCTTHCVHSTQLAVDARQGFLTLYLSRLLTGIMLLQRTQSLTLAARS